MSELTGGDSSEGSLRKFLRVGTKMPPLRRRAYLIIKVLKKDFRYYLLRYGLPIYDMPVGIFEAFLNLYQ